MLIVETFKRRANLSLVVTAACHLSPWVGDDIAYWQICPSAHPHPNLSSHVMYYCMRAKGFRIPHRIDNRLHICPRCVVCLHILAAFFPHVGVALRIAEKCL